MKEPKKKGSLPVPPVIARKRTIVNAVSKEKAIGKSTALEKRPMSVRKQQGMCYSEVAYYVLKGS